MAAMQQGGRSRAAAFPPCATSGTLAAGFAALLPPYANSRILDTANKKPPKPGA